MKSFACGDVVPGCTETWTAADDVAILALVAEHAREAHGLAEVGPDLEAAVRDRIQDVE